MFEILSTGDALNNFGGVVSLIAMAVTNPIKKGSKGGKLSRKNGGTGRSKYGDSKSTLKYNKATRTKRRKPFARKVDEQGKEKGEKKNELGKERKAAGEKRGRNEGGEGEVKEEGKGVEKPAKLRRREERHEVMAQARQQWESLRTEKPGSKRGVELVGKLLELLGGRLLEFCWRHDGSRVVQGMILRGSQEQKKTVFEEILEGCGKEDWCRLVGDRYGRHLGLKIVKSGGRKVRDTVFQDFVRGGVGELMKGVYGAEWLDSVYQTSFNGRQRKEAGVELLFVRERKLYENIIMPKVKKLEDGETVTFEKALELVGKEFAPMVLRNARNYLTSLMEKDSILRSALVHSALLEYLTVLVNRYSDDPTLATSFAQALAPSLVHLTHTKHGAMLSIMVIKLIAAKHRKQAVRSFKSHVRKILEDDAGHVALIALIALVDDTVLLSKQIISEILSSSALAAETARIPAPEKQDFDYIKTICSHPYARTLVIYLLHGSDSRYFNPELYGSIWRPLGDPFPNNSKKDPNVRRSEMSKLFIPMLEKLCESENLSKLMSDVKSAPIAIGLCICTETAQAAGNGLSELFGDRESRKEMLSTVSGRKTAFAMIKAGHESVANKVASKAPESFLRKDDKLGPLILEGKQR